MEKLFIILAIVAIILAEIFICKYREEKKARKYAEEDLIKSQNRCENLESKLNLLYDRIVEIEDTAPKGNRPVDNVLCLQDKLKHYVWRDGNKVKLTILK